jgi:osomolarity two-component system response regulator SKN7
MSLTSRDHPNNADVNKLDGLEAVNKMQEGVKYDMILMDIIMPNLDGVSACHIIRQFDRTPIVAMTSNIRSDDIQMYFQHGESIIWSQAGLRN